jgi:preprotein translocase subunit SecG
VFIFISLIVIGIIVFAVKAGAELGKQIKAENETFMGEHRGWDIYASPHDRGVLAQS